jgi:hypothetical protein
MRRRVRPRFLVGLDAEQLFAMAHAEGDILDRGG